MQARDKGRAGHHALWFMVVSVYIYIINQSIHQSINPSINQSINQSINPSINQSINPSINQSTNLSINQSINQPTIKYNKL